MRAVVQRVRAGSIDIAGEAVAAIGPGFAVLIGVGASDRAEDSERLAAKIAALRVVEDEAGRMNRSLAETGGMVLAIPQFTLYADVRRGRRPDFGAAAPPEAGRRLFDGFCGALRGAGLEVRAGRFGAHMRIALECDGPVTIVLTSDGWAEGDLGRKESSDGR